MNIKIAGSPMNNLASYQTPVNNQAVNPSKIGYSEGSTSNATNFNFMNMNGNHSRQNSESAQRNTSQEQYNTNNSQANIKIVGINKNSISSINLMNIDRNPPVVKESFTDKYPSSQSNVNHLLASASPSQPNYKSYFHGQNPNRFINRKYQQDSSNTALAQTDIYLNNGTLDSQQRAELNHSSNLHNGVQKNIYTSKMTIKIENADQIGHNKNSYDHQQAQLEDNRVESDINTRKIGESRSQKSMANQPAYLNDLQTNHQQPNIITGNETNSKMLSSSSSVANLHHNVKNFTSPSTVSAIVASNEISKNSSTLSQINEIDQNQIQKNNKINPINALSIENDNRKVADNVVLINDPDDMSPMLKQTGELQDFEKLLQTEMESDSISRKQHSQIIPPIIIPHNETPQETNSTVVLLYRGEKLNFKFSTFNNNINWLINFIQLQIVQYQHNVLNNKDSPINIISKIIGFKSSQGNIALSYYMTQYPRNLDLFVNKNLNLEPLFFDLKLHLSQYPNSQKTGLKDFHLIRCIGLGGFSRVYLVQKKDTGLMYALKLIDQNFILKNRKEIIVQNERNVMSRIEHPFILKLQYSFENQYYLGFVMQYCAGGQLFYHIRRIKRMSEEQARFYFSQICLGIQYLHDKHIIYRDIKPENILLDIDGHVRIGDFGLAQPNMDENQFAYSFCGSPEYMAPEMLLKMGHNSAVDHYCLGALLYELITGLPPYYSHNTDQIYEAILSEQLTFPDNLTISRELQHLLMGLLTKHPGERLGNEHGLNEILAHPWFSKINLRDVAEKQIKPLIKPNPLSFNFDEEEFSQGQPQFRKKLISSMEAADNWQPVFKDFYYDRSTKRDGLGQNFHMRNFTLNPQKSTSQLEQQIQRKVVEESNSSLIDQRNSSKEQIIQMQHKSNGSQDIGDRGQKMNIPLKLMMSNQLNSQQLNSESVERNSNSKRESEGKIYNIANFNQNNIGNNHHNHYNNSQNSNNSHGSSAITLNSYIVNQRSSSNQAEQTNYILNSRVFSKNSSSDDRSNPTNSSVTITGFNRENSQINLKGNLRQLQAANPQNSMSSATNIHTYNNYNGNTNYNNNNSLIKTSNISINQTKQASTILRQVASNNNNTHTNNFMSNFPGYPSQNSLISNGEVLKTEEDDLFSIPYQKQNNDINSHKQNMIHLNSNLQNYALNIQQFSKPVNKPSVMNNTNNFSANLGNTNNNNNNFQIQPLTTVANGVSINIYTKNGSLSPQKNNYINNLQKQTPLGYA